MGTQDGFNICVSVNIPITYHANYTALKMYNPQECLVKSFSARHDDRVRGNWRYSSTHSDPQH
jgi:hypothetical protein